MSAADTERRPRPPDKVWNMPDGRRTDDEPASIEDARRQADQALADQRAIEAQLGATRAFDGNGRMKTLQEFEDWRRHAKHAKLVHELRYRFLSRWLRDQDRDRRPATGPWPRVFPPGLSPSALAVQLKKRVGALEGVYYAARAYVEDDTDESWQELLNRLDACAAVCAQAMVTGEPSDGDANASGA